MLAVASQLDPPPPPSECCVQCSSVIVQPTMYNEIFAVILISHISHVLKFAIC